MSIQRPGSGEWFYESGPCRYYCFAEQIKSIEITSDKYWSDGYSAGVNLAPLFTVEFDSLAEYVASGFTTSRPAKTVREVVSELDPATTALMLESDYNIYGGTDMKILYQNHQTMAHTLEKLFPNQQSQSCCRP